MNKQFIDGALEVLREDGRQICKQAAHIIAELAEEIDGLQSLSDFQQQQISCMESDIGKMKCCENCSGMPCDTGAGISTAAQILRCQDNNFYLWELKK